MELFASLSHKLVPRARSAGKQSRSATLPTNLWLRVACCILLLLAGATGVFAQSNGIPKPDDYAGFSKFITDRNIFDPTRQPHIYNSGGTYRPKHIHTPRGTPGIQFVGTMSYEKGLFAFFNGNDMDLSKVLRVGDKLQDYTIADIKATTVTLESADKKEQIELRIGDGLRQDNNKWVFSRADELPAESSSLSSGGSSSSSGPTTDNSSSTPAAPPPEIEQNDVLKRLMEQRAKENQ